MAFRMQTRRAPAPAQFGTLPSSTSNEVSAFIPPSQPTLPVQEPILHAVQPRAGSYSRTLYHNAEKNVYTQTELLTFTVNGSFSRIESINIVGRVMRECKLQLCNPDQSIVYSEVELPVSDLLVYEWPLASVALPSKLNAYKLICVSDSAFINCVEVNMSS